MSSYRVMHSFIVDVSEVVDKPHMVHVIQYMRLWLLQDICFLAR
jgi:hypothetical protein